jgi:hypothetical protein
MRDFAIAASVCLMAAGIAGCAPKPRQPTPTSAVKGIVNLDGKPMPAGEIWFSVSGDPPAVLPISNGAYAGKVHIGKNLVEVFAYIDGPPRSTEPNGPPSKINTIPSTFNGPESTLSAQVTKDGANDFKFDITSQ